MEQRYQDLKLGERGAILSIGVYIILSILKLAVGYLTGSEALKADGLNNTTDIVASIAVLIGLRISQKPADTNHPYGHWKAETVSSLIASLIMILVGFQVLYSAISAILIGKSESPDIIAAWIGICSALIMFIVYQYNRSLAKRVKSHAVMAAAKDNLSDALVSIGTAIGIFGSQFGMKFLDPLTAIIVGFIICKTGWDIFRESSHFLTDGVNEEELEKYKQTINDIYGVIEVKNIKGRTYGNSNIVDIVIFVEDNLDIIKAHEIATNVEDKLIKQHNIHDVHVHVEPISTKSINPNFS
ncbi:cation diffusion facilitator family transporter [Ferdinandcohnia quinoae]|uniref:Cation diffusion facilitator family transporter n=1 Tax=Fredinandcohnia quinoae TaxID=2918902 RepID=A0AAW5DYS0_9BACI|nr:cation diffusion facilitator family transporter [Fredinandcohnia sp. SECRCQ15]MCH1624464.1 cation diffusion facilitator family transporter [Fredinandcohnia sp. SECRCQ15]